MSLPPTVFILELILLYSFVFKHPVSNLLLLSYFCGSDGKESACNSGDLGSIPRSERSPGEGNSCSLQYFFPREFHGQRNLGGLQSMGLQRVRHDWVTNTCTFQATSTRQEVGLSGSIFRFWILYLISAALWEMKYNIRIAFPSNDSGSMVV